ncbi:hypothetical protein E3E31_12350, partial [Thermococcus sp. M39]|uniref:pentapeptide repeat-containing protein n=1 Tax=Thermococcus sp. M39 TaxID=1638262 RepID=UPI00169B62DD
MDNLILCGDTLKDVLENFDKREDIENLYESQTLIMLYDTCVFFRNAKFTKALFYNIIFNTGIDFTGIKCQDFLINKCKFSEQIKFSNAQVTKKVEITNSVFNSNVSFNRAEFKEVSFNFTIFKEGAN